MQNLKERIQEKLMEKGANLSDFKFRYYKESPYQKKRFKSEFVEQECWVYPKGGKQGYVITENDFNHLEYQSIYINMIIAENNTN